MKAKGLLTLFALWLVLVAGTVYFGLLHNPRLALAAAKDPHSHEGSKTICFNLVECICDTKCDTNPD